MRTTAFVLLFWVVAALGAACAHLFVDPLSPVAGTAITIAVLLVAAFGYMRLTAKEATVDHALGVGIAWLALAIVAELTIGSVEGQAWFGIVGSPMRPMLRTLFLFAWIFSPVLFARNQSV